MEPKAGDVILYPVSARSAWSSKVIAIGQLLLGLDRGTKQYSHVALYEKPGWQVESVFPRTRHSRIEASRDYEIWRAVGITPKQRYEIMTWAYYHIGEWYDILYIILAIVSLGWFHFRAKGTEVCSTFVKDAYHHVGIHLKGERPDQIADCKRCIIIASVKGKK